MTLTANDKPVELGKCWCERIEHMSAAPCPDARPTTLAAQLPPLALHGQLMQGQLLWRGPRVRMGMFEGQPAAVMPHPASGRADYFGCLCNRCCSHGSQLVPFHEQQTSCRLGTTLGGCSAIFIPNPKADCFGMHWDASAWLIPICTQTGAIDAEHCAQAGKE